MTKVTANPSSLADVMAQQSSATATATASASASATATATASASASASAPGPKKPKKSKASETQTSATQTSAVGVTPGVDTLDKPAAAKKSKAAAAQAVTETSLPGIAESFPIADLSAIDGKGKVGDKFMLDAGSLQGLELQVRRVVDGDTPGFELFFKVTQARLPELMEALGKAGAEPRALVYRGTEVGEDGIVRYTAASAAITAAGTHAPKDTNTNANTWAHTLKGSAGSSVEVIEPKAAKAIRGLVRVQLRGTDAECTKQLQGFVKQLGMEALLAPPTPNSKERMMLMRCLWQHDQAAAETLAKDGLDKLTPAELRERLKALGFTDARLDALSWKEVFPGHFTTVDPEQMRVMQGAGARYLYSTVQAPEHVLSILQGGQQASKRRFQEGLIVTGMSSNTDFSSGGAVGVFTRLVTQDAIWNGQAWIGRTYKVILKPEILARTDWYGWNGDYFGKSWELDSKVNFGPDLVARIDNASSYGGYGTYASSNELIFRTGNSPEYIAHIVATTDDARQALIKLLKDKGYTPPGGMSIEELVRLEPKFFQFGEPALDLADPAAFIEEAFSDAASGAVMKLRRVLQGEPFSQAQRAQVELRMLRHSDEKVRTAAVKALGANGGVAMSVAELEAVLGELQGSPDAGLKATATSLLRDCAATLAKTNSDVIAALLKEHYQSSAPAFDYQGETWAQLIDHLFSHFPSAPQSAMQQWVVNTGLPLLVANSYNPAPADKLLAKHSLVSLSDTELQALVQELGTSTGYAYSPTVPWKLTAFIKGCSDKAKLTTLAKAILAHDTIHAGGALGSIVSRLGNAGMPNSELVALLSSRPKTSPVREQLFYANAVHWLKPGNDELLPLLKEQVGDRGLHFEPHKLFDAFGDDPKSPMLHFGLACAGNHLTYSYAGNPNDLRALMRQRALFEVGDQKTFIADAITLGKTDKGAANLRLAWLLSEPEGLDLDMRAALTQLYTEREVSTWGDVVTASVQWLTATRGKNPLVASFEDILLADLTDKPALANNQLSVVQTCLDEVLASKHPAIIKRWGELKTAQTLYIQPQSIINALKALATDPSPEAAAARSNLLAKTATELLTSLNDPIFDALLGLGVTREMLGVDTATTCAQINNYVNYNLYAATTMTTLPSYPRLLLSGANGELDAGLIAALMVELETTWPANNAVKLIDLLLQSCPAELKVKLLQLRKKLAP